MKLFLASLACLFVSTVASASDQGKFEIDVQSTTSDLRVDVRIGTRTGCEPVYLDLDVSVPKFVEWGKDIVLPVSIPENQYLKGYWYVMDRLKSKLAKEDFAKVQRAMADFSNELPPPYTCTAEMPIYGTAYVSAEKLKKGKVVFKYPKGWMSFEVIELTE